MKIKQKKAFTLLELVVVIIIVGVLASLAFPRFIRLIERARAVEALTELNVIRQGVERCYVMRGVPSYAQCQPGGLVPWERFGLDDPAMIPNAHFSYTSQGTCAGAGTMGLIIVAVRNTKDLSMVDPGGSFKNISLSCSTIGLACTTSRIFYAMDNEKVAITGCGFYEGVR